MKKIGFFGGIASVLISAVLFSALFGFTSLAQVSPATLFKMVGGVITPVISTWTLGNASNRIAGGYFTDINSTTGTIGTLTLSGATSGNFDVGGTIEAGSGNTTLTDAAGKILAAAINTLGIGQGGTGGTTAATAKANLGIAPFDIDSATPLNSVTRIRSGFWQFLQNSSFEYWKSGTSTAPTSWALEGDATVSRSSTASVGSYSAAIVFGTANTGQLYQVIDIHTVVDYTFSVYVQRTAGTGAARLVAQRHDSPYTEFASVALSTTAGWQLAVLTVNPTAGTQIRFSISSGDATASTWLIDEAQFEESKGVATTWKPRFLDDSLIGEGHLKLNGAHYYSTPNSGFASPKLLDNNELLAMPFFVSNSVTLNSLNIEVTTQGTANAVIRMGIYNDTDGEPDGLLLDAGTVGSTTTGVKTIAISQAVSPGVYWLGIAGQGSPATQATVRAVVGTAMPNALGSTYTRSVFTDLGITGALPVNFTVDQLTNYEAPFIQVEL